MPGFDQWLAQFEKSEGDLGNLARFAQNDPHRPRMEYPGEFRIWYTQWLAEHPDTDSADGRLKPPLMDVLRAAFDQYTRDVVDDGPPPSGSAQAEPTYDALVAAAEGGTQDLLLARFRGLRLDASEREQLLVRATAVRHGLAERGVRSGDRFLRMTTLGLVCHTDADTAANWLAQHPFEHSKVAGPEEMARQLADAVDVCWTQQSIADLARAAAYGDRATELYALVAELCRRTGITVEPTAALAAGAVQFYVGWHAVPHEPHGLAVTTDPRQDPLLPKVLPELDLTRFDVYSQLGESIPHESVDGLHFVSFLLENGLLDRQLLLRKTVDALRWAAEGEAYPAPFTRVLDALRPTESEFAPCHDSYARLVSRARSVSMSPTLIAHAVGALVREGRIPGPLVDEWVRGATATHDLDDRDVAVNCAIAIGETVGTDALTDTHIVDLVRCVTGLGAARPLALMRALIRHAEYGRLTADQIAACAHEALLWPEEETSTSLIRLIVGVLEREPERADVLVPLLADAFWHPSPHVRSEALGVAAEHGERIGDTTRHRLAEASAQLEPELRERAQAAFGRAPERQTHAEDDGAPEAAGVAMPADTVPASMDGSVFDPVRQALPERAAEHWTMLVRPALTLDTEKGDGPVVGYLGGVPQLPRDMPWPMWRGRPLTLQASLDCALLPRRALDIPLPEDGTLLFFYYEWSDLDEALADEDGYDDWFCPGLGEPGEGARLLYVPATESVRRRPAPESREIFPHLPLRLNRVRPTMPGLEHVCWHDAGIDVLGIDDLPEATGQAEEAATERYGMHSAQVGGYANSCQGAAETDLAIMLAGGYEAAKEAVREAARGIVLLASFEEVTDRAMLYWMISREDLAARRFDKAMPVRQR